MSQEARTVSTPLPGDGYLVPDGESRVLEKEELGQLKVGRLTKVVANVPEGEYIFQVFARPPKSVDSWVLATYHFLMLVLPGE